jgi:glycosyltransferase involved in cell wall biosynthesis
VQSKHVLIVSHAWYGDVIGGAFRLASEFAEHLATTGHQVSYVCCAATNESAKVQTEEICGVRISRYKQDQVRRNGVSRMWYHVRQTERLVRQIHAADPVHVVSGHSPLQMLGAIRCLGPQVPATYTVHSPFDDEMASNRSAGLMNSFAVRLARWADRWIVAKCKSVQTDSAYTLRSMTTKHGQSVLQKGVVAPGWVETNQFHPASNRSELRRKLGPAWNVDLPLFFTLRRLENRMGLETLVAACQQLRQEGLEFRTLIGGSGSLKEILQQQIVAAGIQDSVCLLGRLPEDQLAGCYAAADCFVLPTKALECFGLIVLEAFACNTPVIASNVAAIPELAAQQGRDWMFEPGHVEQLTDRMRQFIKGQLRPTGDLRAIAMQYDKPKILKQWEELLFKPLEARG